MNARRPPSPGLRDRDWANARALTLGVAIVWLGLIQLAAQSDGVAFLMTDLRTGRPIASSRIDVIDASTDPGSVIKVATLAAALESGVITERTAIMCPRTVKVGDRTLTCVHPDLHRPLRPAEALAHSCNGFFASIAARLPRSALDAALVRLGLPRSDPSKPVAAAALGVGGLRTSPHSLMNMLVKVSAEPNTLGWRTDTLRIVREGLTGAATYGTAATFNRHGIDALAKTGTVLSGGREQGIVAGVTPRQTPEKAFVVVASGASGSDAADLAVARLAPTIATRPMVRIGSAGRDRGYTVRTMPLEDYVAGVVAGEAAAESGPAALQALAITVRTFALANLKRHQADGFDLCDLTHCQVLRASTAATRAAAQATDGRILIDHGKPASIYYSASCGGFTERPSAVWPGADDSSFLPSRRDEVHQDEPGWSSEINASDLLRVLRAGGFRGDAVRGLRIEERDRSGRVTWLAIDGLTPNRISGSDFRTLAGRVLGWQSIKSTAFDVTRRGAGYSFAGRGFGHGVGLCEVGAARRAARGDSTDAILAAYFPGLKTGAIPAATLALLTSGDRVTGHTATTSPKPPASRLIVTVPESEQREHDRLEDLATRARDQLASVLGIAPPGRITLRFHPTVESYQRATGQPWFTGAATHGTTIELLPPSALQKRGSLDRTLRHELVHVLTADALAGRPRWVIEGAAEYFADGGTLPIAGRPSTRDAASRATHQPAACPADREFRAPSSPKTLENAYARARECFVERLESGLAWNAP
jgi:SpoIID/LytB domain protein